MALGNRSVFERPAPSPEHPLPQRTWNVPWVSGTVLVGSVLVFVADMVLQPQLAAQGLPSLAEIGLLYGPLIAEGQWWRTLSSVFVHGGFIHILFNMSVVWSLGIHFERAVGSLRLLLISLITTLGSTAAVLLFAWDQPTVGASGMILGWAGAMLMIANAQGRRMLQTWLIQIAIISALPFFVPEIRISWQGHLGGFLFGLPCGVLLRDRKHFYPGAVGLLLASVVLVAVLTWLGARAAGPM